MEAAANGHIVYFITVSELLDELARDVQENRLDERLVKLLILLQGALRIWGCSRDKEVLPCALGVTSVWLW
jgi:hypothetical protein